MTQEQKCIAELFEILDDITERARKRDISLFRTSGISGCDMYQGLPPICRVRDDILNRYEDTIYNVLKLKNGENSDEK